MKTKTLETIEIEDEQETAAIEQALGRREIEEDFSRKIEEEMRRYEIELCIIRAGGVRRYIPQVPEYCEMQYKRPNRAHRWLRRNFGGRRLQEDYE